MGNWRTVRVTGMCEVAEVAALRSRLAIPYGGERWGCLCNGGILGLPNFAATEFDVMGNLGERGYTPEDVARHLEDLAAAAPSLTARVHCGGDYEDRQVVATVRLADGKAVVGPPEQDTLEERTSSQIAEGLMRALQKARQR